MSDFLAGAEKQSTHMRVRIPATIGCMLGGPEDEFGTERNDGD
jgi:hypothetical protein